MPPYAAKTIQSTLHHSMLRTWLVLVAGFFVAGSLAASTLELDRKSYAPGQSLQVTFAASGLASNAWAGIVPSQVPHGSEAENDQHDVAYQYLQGATSGTLTFQAPAQPGRYDVRLHDTDSDGREVASVTFEVRAPDLSAASLEIEKVSYIPGEAIQVRFSAPAGLPRNAWAGIVPSHVAHGSEAENDRHDVAYQYLEERTDGVLDFHAPAQPGRYDFRLHDSDSDGREIATASFTVLETVGADLIAEQLASQGRVPLYGIRFASGQATLGADSTSALAEVAQLLRRDRSLELRIEGHTDDRGGAMLNQRLSERRAETVKQHLVDTFDINPDRLRVAGLGDSRPMTSNETAAGRAQNRRVELVRLSP